MTPVLKGGTTKDIVKYHGLSGSKLRAISHRKARELREVPWTAALSRDTLLLRTRRLHSTIGQEEQGAAYRPDSSHGGEKTSVEVLEIGRSDGGSDDEGLGQTDDGVADAGDSEQAGAEL